MNKNKLIEYLESFAPSSSAEKWDCVGFISNTKRDEFNKAMLCLTPTKDIVKQALDNSCDIIISHHPMFYVDLFDEYYHPIIDIYAMHTNLDKAKFGTTDTLIKQLGFDEYKIELEHDFLRGINFSKDYSLEKFILNLKQLAPCLRYTNKYKKITIKKVAFCAGSGSEFIPYCKNSGFDCLVTGDLKFHTALDSEIIVIDIGHFESEIPVLKQLEQLLNDKIETLTAKEISPFIY